MRTQLGSPGRAGSSRAVQVRNASHRSPVARATTEQTSYDSTDADLVRSSSAATRDAAPRYPGLDLDEQAQQQLSRPVEQPRLRVGATDEDTEASCLCGPDHEASVPAPAPEKFNPVPIVATAATVPIFAKWYTTNPATNGKAPIYGSSAPDDAVVVAPESSPEVTLPSPLPSDDISVPAEPAVDTEDVSQPSEAVPSVPESAATGELQADTPAADPASTTVKITPILGDDSETVVIEAPVAQNNDLKNEFAAIEQPAVQSLALVPNPEETGQLVSDTIIQAPVPTMTADSTLVTNSANNLATMQPAVMKVLPVSITQGNETQGASAGTDGRYPALKVDASFDTQYAGAAPPETPNYMPRPGVQRSANCSKAAKGTIIDPSTVPGGSQFNIASSGGDYSSQYQRQVEPDSGRYLAQRPAVPDTIAPPASPMPLAAPYSGSGSYKAPSPHSNSETDPWGILEHQGAYGMPQGLLNIDGGGGTYGAFSYGPPSNSYAAPPANTQEGYRAQYSQAPSQGKQQYYSQPPSQASQQPQAYSQRGGGQQSYQGGPAEGYYYPGGSSAPPPAARRSAPAPQYAAPPAPGNYSYQASPAGTQQDPYAYAGQYSGNQPYPAGGNQPYGGGGNQPYGGGGGNVGGTQPYAGGGQSYAPAQYGNQPYSAPPSRGGNYAPPPESSQGGYPGIELLSPGYPEYERGHKNASQQKPQAPPPEAYYPGIDSTYSAYGMRAPTAPTSNPPGPSEYSSTQNTQSYGYQSYTAPSNYQGQAQPGDFGSAGSRGPVAGYNAPPPPVVAPPAESSYYQRQNGGGYHQAEAAPMPRAYGQWPTANKSDAEEAATLVLPVADAPDYSLPETRVSGPVTSDIVSVQSSVKSQLSKDHLHQQLIPIATLRAPTHLDAIASITAVPPPTLDIGLLAAAFCCMMAAKSSGSDS